MILFESLFIALIIMTVYALIEDNKQNKPKAMATKREYKK